MLPFLAALAIQAPAAAPAESERWTTTELEAVSREIQGQVEELRGLEFRAPVAVKLTDKKGFLDYALQRQKETESPAKMTRDETVGKLLGLMPPAMDLQAQMLELLQEQVGGFYDPTSKTFYLMDTFKGGLARIILAHELTHALDDQYFDIDGGMRKCGDETDAMLAYQSVVEGSGQRAMTQWTYAHMGSLSKDDLDQAAKMGAKQLAQAPPYLWKPLMAAYMKGDGFLSKGQAVLRNAARNAAGDAPAKDAYVRAAFQDPPASSEQILHPDKYWSSHPRDLPVRVRLSTDSLPQGWTLLGTDTLGELYLGLVTTPLADRKGLDTSDMMGMLAVKYTNVAAEGWGGDRLALIGRGDDRVLVLVTVWDTDKDADEFVAALAGGKASDKTSAKDGDKSQALAEGAAPVVIPLWTSKERSRENGFVPSFTPTAATVTRSTVAGESSVVVVRVGSFTNPSAPENRLDTFQLPYTIERPAK